MKTFRRSFLILSILLLTFTLVSTVLAGSLVLTGTLTPGGPTEPQVAQIVTPNCTGATVVFEVLYQAHSFTVDASGVYTITEPGTQSAVYLYDGGFNPALPAQNCVAASNSNPIGLTYALNAGTVYTVVVIEDTFEQDGLSYSLTIAGPGNVNLLSPACPYPLPSGSAIYSVPAGAPTFFEPRLDAQNNFNLPAGTWYISEFSGDFAKVWMACQAQPFYIPANAVSR
ncbi:MAG: hypothetical protein IPK19_12810 [Chloroflexi bacterium]|nr:hypothetical protein [Chloroflexota bacterium]